MLSNFIELGTKIELKVLDKESEIRGIKQKAYYSSVYDILSEDRIEITMPMEKTKILLLSDVYEYELIFYGPIGLYQCTGRIVDRYKNGNAFLLLIELTSGLRKYQRREYYRFNCAIELGIRPLDENETAGVLAHDPYCLKKGLPQKKAVIVDISGGGLRFLSNTKYPPESFILCSYILTLGDESKKYDVAGEILSIKPVENRKGVFEHRVKYHNIDVDTREEIIKYIFEAERKTIRKDTTTLK